MAREKIPTEIRYALWQAYDCKCCYTDRYILDYQDLIIDHIIPISTSQEVLEAKKTLHSLADNFNIGTALQNLAPCLSRPNSTKGKTPFPEHVERFYIQMAKKKMLRVENERVKFRQEVSKSFETAVSEYRKEQFPIIRPETYEKHRIVGIHNKIYISNTYVNYDIYVRINGFLPSVYRENGGCIIQFNDDEGMFQLYHEQILELIGKWKRDGIKLLVRELTSYDGTKCFVNLLNISIHLVPEAFEQFRSVLEDFLTEYDNQYQNFLHFLQIENFPIVKDGQYCVLRIAERAEWRMLLEYSQQHNLKEDNANQLIFTHSRSLIICLSSKDNIVKFWLKPAVVQDIYIDSFIVPDYEMEIQWKLPNEEERGRISSGEVWTAKQILTWINQTLDKIKANQSHSSRPNLLKMMKAYLKN